MIEDNENIEPNLFSEKQKTYELINDEINNSNHINIDISPSDNYNMQTPNNKLESNISSQNIKNLDISNNNDNEEN
jgi:hypothetical protein